MGEQSKQSETKTSEKDIKEARKLAERVSPTLAAMMYAALPKETFDRLLNSSDEAENEQ